MRLKSSHVDSVKSFQVIILGEVIDERISRHIKLCLFLKVCAQSQKSIFQLITPSPSSTYNYFNTKGIKHLTRVRLGLSHLRDHKFKHGLLDSVKPICCCRLDTGTTFHYLLHCPNFINKLLLDVSRITNDGFLSCDTTLVKLHLYGDGSFDPARNTVILNTSCDFMLLI